MGQPDLNGAIDDSDGLVETVFSTRICHRCDNIFQDNSAIPRVKPEPSSLFRHRVQ
ncbi:MAG TPA: hypothetical protein VFH48_37790 [Chloroflexota bacterium]|nr:hypothetical protein [Chloroflexota bacterium]